MEKPNFYAVFSLNVHEGFIQRRGGEGGEPGISPLSHNLPPPRNLEMEYGYYCGAITVSYSILHVTGHKYVSSKCCLESLSLPEYVNLRGSTSRRGMPTDPPSWHAHLRMPELAFTRYSCFPPQLKILYEPCVKCNGMVILLGGKI